MRKGAVLRGCELAPAVVQVLQSLQSLLLTAELLYQFRMCLGLRMIRGEAGDIWHQNRRPALQCTFECDLLGEL